jgi:hypothetical protein
MSPNQLVIISLTVSKYRMLIEAAKNHQIISTNPSAKATPEILTRIEEIELICGLYIVK